MTYDLIFYPITLSILKIACDKVWYKQTLFYNSNFSISNGSASLLKTLFLKKISSKMISLQGHSRPWRKHLFTQFLDSSSPLQLDDKLSDQSTKFLEPYFAVVLAATTLVLKYTKEDLQRILEIVLEARSPITFEKSQDKPLKANSPDMYYNKSYRKYYNFCQQCEDYFATYFLQDKISFHW